MITASLVKELREKTGVAMMECKNALKETEGDIDAAIKILRERGEAKAEKKASRDANEGIIVAALAESGKSGVLVEINCETDFVAKNENFQAFVGEVAATVLAGNVTDLEAAKALPKGDETLEGFIKTKVLEMGENLQFRRFDRLTLNGEGAVASYIHLGGKVGVLIEVSSEKAETASSETFNNLLKDISRLPCTLHLLPKDILFRLNELSWNIFALESRG